MNNQRGFSLIEIMVVVGIIGMLVGVFLGPIQNARHKAKEARAKQEIRQIAAAVDQFEMENGEYPGALQTLVDDAFIKAKLLRDPWGQDYIFSREGAPEGLEYDVFSYGDDKAEGGTGAGKDIKLSELQ